jgi:hypothetical protein
MPLNPVRNHAAAHRCALSAFAERMGEGFGPWATLADGRGEIGMIPIYSMPVRRLAARQWNKGWRSGWRYFWTHPAIEYGMIVEVIRVGNRKARLASLSVGPAAVQLRDRLSALERQYAHDKRRYRPRILRLPWIGMEAIWLNTDSLRIADRFFSRTDDLAGDAFRDRAVGRARDFLGRTPAATR